MVSAPPTASSTTVPGVSLPSQENQGARPGEVTGGVGALPGRLGEAGVAVPPEVRGRFLVQVAELETETTATEGSAGGLITTSTAPPSSAPLASDQSSGVLAEIAAGASAGAEAIAASAAAGVEAVATAIFGENKDVDTASGLKDPTLPSVTAGGAAAAAIDPSVAGFLGTSTSVPVTSGVSSAHTTTSSGTSAGLPDLSASTARSNSSYALAAPLPATFLGTGAAHGATDLETTPGVNTATASSTAPTTAASLSTSAGDSSTAGTSLLSAPRQPNDRTESLASVTAIRHGHAGSRDHEGESSPLATLTSSDDVTTAGQKSTARGTGPNHTHSLSPGDESQSVGHPSTKGQEGTSRTPGKYPPSGAAGAAVGESKHHHDDAKDKHTPPSSTAPTSTSTDTASSTNHSTEKTTPSTSTPTKTAATPTGTPGTAGRKSLENDGHKRTGSTSSTGKKVGFMQKLKGEVKIISGKMSHDEGKITLGEKIKHGGEFTGSEDPRVLKLTLIEA